MTKRKHIYMCLECKEDFHIDDLYTCEFCNARYCEDCLENNSDLLDEDGKCSDCLE